jgi:methylenetetrahydrofolate--tRNA-(uracil-5-)-methyltransferase
MVGFQTKMKYGDQQKIFRDIPGLQNAEFARFGGIHRNTFINSPMLLDNFLRLKTNENLYFAGQITGVEGYVESASMGLLTGIFIVHQLANKLSDQLLPPNTTAIGSLLNYITKDKNQFIKSRINQQNNFKDIDCLQEQELKNLENNSDNSFNDFQPMNVNFGLFMELAKDIKKDQRKQAYSDRAFRDLELWKKSISI